MAKISLNQSLLRVICEACVQALTSECGICGGRRFYLWDPTTLFCYQADGVPLTAVDKKGKLVPVTRRTAVAFDQKTPDVHELLACIAKWVEGDPTRKWKLSYDEDGWCSCVWFNRYKKICFETSDMDLSRCISRTYGEIVKRASKSSRAASR